MTRTYPTYQLGADFRKKFESFEGHTTEEAEAYFAQELAGIDEYVLRAEADRSKRDDHELRRTPKAEYAKALIDIRDNDRKNRAAFNAAPGTLIIMPDCLSIHDTPCEKVDHKRGDICKRCLSECQARQLSDLAAKYRARVLFSKRKLKKQLRYHKRRMGDIGVVGIACILMLAEGMSTADEAGVPSRGVPLMFCGCEHWNDNPFTSAFSMAWLESILEEKHGRVD